MVAGVAGSLRGIGDGVLGKRASSASFEVFADMEHKETGCQTPEGPILCINNCGFFGNAATMNMCSKCHKEMILKQDRAKFAASSIDSIMNGSDSINGKDTVVVDNMDTSTGQLDCNVIPAHSSGTSSSIGSVDVKAKQGPSRCNTCRKRVGLTGFSCRCGHLFCAAHRYSDKHNCTFDYQSAARDAIAKANPVVKSEKLEKI